MPHYEKPGRPPHPDLLTPAEWRVVQSAQHGLTNPEIAKRLGISVNAVKFHIKNAILKTGVPNKRALLSWVGIPQNSAANTSIQREGDYMSDQKFSIGQIARSVNNAAESEQWYREVLGLEHLYTFDTLVFFNCGGVRLMLSQGEVGGKDESIIYLKSLDIHKDYLRLQQQGVEFTHAPHKIHQHEDGSEEWMAFFTDLENRPLGLMCKYEV